LRGLFVWVGLASAPTTVEKEPNARPNGGNGRCHPVCRLHWNLKKFAKKYKAKPPLARVLIAQTAINFVASSSE
jgi:hypothetical protein